jgi:hypothetical protein
MNTETLILTGQGYNLTITDEALTRRQNLLTGSSTVTAVTSNDESAQAAVWVRRLAALRIEVDKCRKEIKEPVIRIGKLIDTTAKEFLEDITFEESRIKGLIGDHAEVVAEAQRKALEREREAFEVARAAREALEQADTISNVVETIRSRTERMAASDEVAATKMAQGVRFAWDFEVINPAAVFKDAPEFCEITIKRSTVLQWLKNVEEMGSDPVKCASVLGIDAFKKPIVSTK